MRSNLAAIEGVRKTFFATFGRFGTRAAFKGALISTALFTDVTDEDGNAMCDHIWFTVGKQIEALMLEEGDKISFDARVTAYVKGYMGRRPDVEVPLETDYGLSYPSKFIRISRLTQKEKQAIESERYQEALERKRKREQEQWDATLRPETEPLIARLADALMQANTKESRRAINRSPEYMGLTQAERNRAEWLRHQRVMRDRKRARKKQRSSSDTPSPGPER